MEQKNNLTIFLLLIGPPKMARLYQLANPQENILWNDERRIKCIHDEPLGSLFELLAAAAPADSNSNRTVSVGTSDPRHIRADASAVAAQSYFFGMADTVASSTIIPVVVHRFSQQQPRDSFFKGY